MVNSVPVCDSAANSGPEDRGLGLVEVKGHQEAWGGMLFRRGNLPKLFTYIYSSR